MKKKLGLLIPTSALLLVGGAVLLSVPRSPASATPATSFVTSTSTLTANPTPTKAVTKARKQELPVTRPTPTDTPDATPADTPVPQPTATAQPTPTQVPSWHTVGNYSGTGPTSNFATLLNVTGGATGNGNILVQWTCQPTVALPKWSIGFGVAPIDGGNGGTGQGVWCESGQTSGTFQLNAYSAEGGPDWYVSMNDATDAGGAWTATVEVWYKAVQALACP